MHAIMCYIDDTVVQVLPAMPASSRKLKVTFFGQAFEAGVDQPAASLHPVVGVIP